MTCALHLILLHKWYDLIDQGKKKTEYRDNTPYWHKRFFENPPDIIIFHRGYTKKTMSFLVTRITVKDDKIAIKLGAREK